MQHLVDDVLHPGGAALHLRRDEDVLGQVNRKSALVRAAFEAFSQLPGITATRSLGLVGACDLGEPAYLGRRGWKVYEEARRRGAYLRPLGNTVYIAPALTISEDELRQLLAIVQESLEATA